MLNFLLHGISLFTKLCDGDFSRSNISLELFDLVVDSTTDNGCLPEDQAMSIIKALLESVQYLHSKDIVHRDIKPDNFLIGGTEQTKDSVFIIDFGLAKCY